MYCTYVYAIIYGGLGSILGLLTMYIIYMYRPGLGLVVRRPGLVVRRPGLGACWYLGLILILKGRKETDS